MAGHGFDEAILRAFGALVIKLQDGSDLSQEETKAAYLQIWQGTQPDLQQGALIAAHQCKGPTTDELVGLAQSHDVEWSRCFPHTVNAPEPHLGIVGVGMDSLKSFNVSSAAAVVAAACGAYVHKVGAPGMTGVSGSHDAFVLWGVDAFAPLERAIKAVETTRLGFTTPVTPHLKHMGIGRVLSQLRLKTVIHLAGPMGCHSGETHKIVGVPSADLVDRVAGAMLRLGYQRAYVPCGEAEGLPGRYMDEFSNLGPTHVAELRDGKIERYTLTPADFGVTQRTQAEVESADTREENARVGAQVIAGRSDDARTELLAINAAACLHLMGKCDDLKAGTQMALAAIREGRALGQLKTLIETQNVDPSAGFTTLQALLA